MFLMPAGDYRPANSTRLHELLVPLFMGLGFLLTISFLAQKNSIPEKVKKHFSIIISEPRVKFSTRVCSEK